mgnify:CR=1 FL=1
MMKVGAVGLGNRITHVFLEFKNINPDFSLIAFVDPQPIGKSFAKQHNFFPSKQYSSLAEMLKNEKLDLLMVGSPNHLHLEHIKLGLEAGLTIFAEKPIVANEQQTWDLAELIEKYGKSKLLVGLVLRYSKHGRSLRTLINDNVIGNIVSIEASEHIMPWHGGFFMRNWRRKISYSGGFMLEKCCHDLDFYSMVVGCRPIKNHPEFSYFKKRLQYLGSWILRKVSNTNIEDAASGFRVYSRNAMLHLNIYSDFSYCMETLIQLGLENMKIIGVDISVNPKTRESRLFKNFFQYIWRQSKTIINIFLENVFQNNPILII